MKGPILAALAFALCGSFLLSLLPGEKKGAAAFLSFLFSLSLLSLVLGHPSQPLENAAQAREQGKRESGEDRSLHIIRPYRSAPAA